MTKKTSNSIATIKGFACLIVFLGHFWDCFYWCSDLDKMNAGVINLVQHIPFYFFVCGGFMVYVFCVLSGYFASQKKIEDVFALFRAIIKRYLRFLIPVLLSNILFSLGVIFDLFPTSKAGAMLNNERMPEFVWNAQMIYQSFRLRSTNGALWMIASLCIGNCMLYVYTWICTKFKNKYVKALLFVVAYSGCIVIYKNDILTATLTGMLFGYALNKMEPFLDKCKGVILSVGTIFWVGGATAL